MPKKIVNKRNSMKNIRIFPKSDIKGPNLVKGVHLEGLRVLGRPELLAPKYYQDAADEIIYIDMVASLYGRNNLIEIVSRTAEKLVVSLILENCERLRGL